MARLDDLTGDGIGELIVGAPEFGVSRGYVNVYSGATQSLLIKIYGVVDNGVFGRAVARAGDLDGDGTPDYLVGAPGSPFGYVHARSGQTHAMLWSASGIQALDRFGASVACVGDYDGDAVDDVLVGAPDHDGVFVDTGAAFLLSGSDGSILVTMVGVNANGRFGASVASIDDDARRGMGAPTSRWGEPGASSGRPGRADAGVLHAYSGATTPAALRAQTGQTARDALGYLRRGRWRRRRRRDPRPRRGRGRLADGR